MPDTTSRIIRLSWEDWQASRAIKRPLWRLKDCRLLLAGQPPRERLKPRWGAFYRRIEVELICSRFDYRCAEIHTQSS